MGQVLLELCVQFPPKTIFWLYWSGWMCRYVHDRLYARIYRIRYSLFRLFWTIRDMCRPILLWRATWLLLLWPWWSNLGLGMQALSDSCLSLPGRIPSVFWISFLFRRIVVLNYIYVRSFPTYYIWNLQLRPQKLYSGFKGRNLNHFLVIWCIR